MSSINFLEYCKANTKAFYTNIPMTYLEEFKSYMKDFSLTGYRIRYRGLRKLEPMDKRKDTAKRNDCLKAFGETFSVYPKQK